MSIVDGVTEPIRDCVVVDGVTEPITDFTVVDDLKYGLLLAKLSWRLPK